MSRPRRPLTDEEIILPPTTFIGGVNQLIVRHNNDPKHKRSFGVVIMSPAGLDLFKAPMRPLDKAVLITLVSKLKWFKVDYEESRTGGNWTLRYAEDGQQIMAKIKESGIVTTGLSFFDIAASIQSGSEAILETLAETYMTNTGGPIDRERANRILNFSTKKTYSVDQVKRSIGNIKALGVIVGHERAGPDKLYYVLNPFLYCNGPTFMRNALIRHLANTTTGSVVHFSEHLANSGPPRRRKTNSELILELEEKNAFIKSISDNHELSDEERERAHRLLADNLNEKRM